MIKPEYAVTADGRQLDATTIDDSYIEAVNVNRSIIVNAQSAQMSLYEVCKGLKRMRDGKLYKKFGYQNFEEYCEKETGIKYRQAFNFIKIIEAYGENLQPVAGFGTTKLALLASLSEEERTELTENTDLESVSKRELEEKVKEIKALRKKSEEQSNYISSLEKQKSEKDSDCKRLSDELDSLSRQRDELCRQIEELESRPIDVAVSETDSHEIENLKKAMKTCDDRWAKKYSELEEETVLRERELHQDYKAQIEELTVEYEAKLSEAERTATTEVVSDVKETFKMYYTTAYNSFESLIKFVGKQDGSHKDIFIEKIIQLANSLKESAKNVR